MNTTTYKKENSFLRAWRRMRKNKPAMVGLVIIMVFVVVAVFANVIADYETVALAQNPAEKLQPPSKDHWFGTDDLGRDVFARIIHGARISLSIGFVIVGFAATVGSLLGGIVTYYGGVVDAVIMRFLDVFMSIPGMLLMLSLVSALGPGIDKLIIAMTIVTTPSYVRLARASMLTIAGCEYIEAAKVCGCSDLKIIVRHLFPNAMGPILVTATMSLASTIIAISGFSYLGVGISSPTPEWGAMLAEARGQMRYQPHLVIIPGLSIMLVSDRTSAGWGKRDG